MSTSSHSRGNTDRTRPPRTTMSAGSSPRATARRRERSLGTARRFSHDGEVRFAPVDVLTPRSLEEALRLKAERLGWSREGGKVWLGAGLTYAEAMEPRLAEALPALAEASRTVGGPQIRNRGTIGGNLGTSSPAGDALPPLLV